MLCDIQVCSEIDTDMTKIVMKGVVLLFVLNALIGVGECCVSGYYADTDKCLPCPEHCTICSSASSCDSCSLGYFGRSCSQVCPNHCHDNECNKTSGVCLSCSKGYFSENNICVKCPENCTACNSLQYCFACKSGYKGKACEDKCTTCRSGTSCDKNTGYCLESCSAGRSGELCTVNCDNKCTFCERSNERVCISCAYNRFGDSCNNICSQTCLNQTCRDRDGVCTYGEREENPTEYECHSSTGKTAAITAGVIVGLLEPIFIFAIIIVFVYRKKIGQYVPCTINWCNSVEDRLSNLRKRYSTRDGNMDLESSLLASQDTSAISVPTTSQSEVLVDAEKDTLKETNIFTEKPPDNISDNKSDAISERTDTESNGNENGRTKDVVCVATSAHVGARKTTLNAVKCHYITSFEPIKDRKEATEFWRMVWEAGCYLIVMLTSFLEMEEVYKFDQYLLCPEQNSEINIILLRGYNRAKYALRKLKLKNKKYIGERAVWVFRYVTWPHKWDTEDLLSLLEFTKEVNAFKSGFEGPILVHSSVEVHRCTTYITFDMVTQEDKDRNEDDIRVCLKQSKTQRLDTDPNETTRLTRLLFQPSTSESIQQNDKTHSTWTPNVTTFKKIDGHDRNDWLLPKS